MNTEKNKFYYIDQYHKEATKKSIELMHRNSHMLLKDVLDAASKAVRDMKDPEKTPGFYLVYHENNPMGKWKDHLTFEHPVTENEKKITQILEGFTKR